MTSNLVRNREEAIFNEFNPRKKLKMEVNWAELPTDLVVRIVDKHLVSFVDGLAFSGVCRSWRKACDIVNLKHKWGIQMPWLMLTDGNLDITEDESIGPYLKPGCVENENDVIIEASGEDIPRRTLLDMTQEDVIVEGSGEDIPRRSLLDLTQEEVRCYNVECGLGYGRDCWGSSHGWIVTQGIDHNMYLFNPLTKDRLDLPSRLTLPFLWDNPGTFLRAYFINRAILLKIRGDTLVVVLVYDGYSRIAIAKPGDTQWTQIVSQEGLDFQSRRIMDVVYRSSNKDGLGSDGDGLVFLNENGNIAILNPDHLQKKQQQQQPLVLNWFGCYVQYIQSVYITEDSDYNFYDHLTYLVNCGRDLLLVLRMLDTEINGEEMVREDEHDIDYYKTVNFKVYKFHFDDRSWEELKDLEDVALFVGNNATMSVRATEMGCQRNCIYFADSYWSGSHATKDKLAGHDIGVFRMGDSTIRPLKLENNTHLRSSYCCPMWFRPAI